MQRYNVPLPIFSLHGAYRLGKGPCEKLRQELLLELREIMDEYEESQTSRRKERAS
jgi:hypothetical protein